MSTLDVVAYAGERHGGVKPANFLDIGGGASAQVMADGLHIILGDPQVKAVFVNVFGGITACDAVADGIVHALEMLGDEANKPLVVRLDGNNVEEGHRILAEADHPLVTMVDTMDGAADRPPSSRSERLSERETEDNDMAIFLTERSRVVVQGMTGSEGMKHTTRMLASRHDHRRRREPAQGGRAGRHQGHQDPGLRRRSPSRWPRPAPTCRSCSCRPAFTKAAVVEAVDAGMPLIVVITEGVPVHDTAEFRAYAEAKGSRIIGPNCPGLISPGKSNAGIIPGDDRRAPGPVGLVSKSGTLTYQMMYELSEYGFSSAVGHRR